MDAVPGTAVPARPLTPRVEMPEDLRKRAEKPILRMLEPSL
ncbi:MAG: hypothetical protein ACKVY0_26170 [Prosthecobacter sp.]